MTYEVIILGHLHMPLYFIGTFTEYSYIRVWTLILICRVARYETGYVNSMKTSPM